MTTMTADKLKALGFDRAAQEVDRQQALKAKLELAYKHYRFVTTENIQKFQDKLKAESTEEVGSNQWGTITQHKRLKFTAVKDYSSVPPFDVLDALETAQNLKCFDTFEIASIEWEKHVPDPILFGRIEGCADRFFIAQWDDDVKIEDILQGDEGFVKAVD